MTHQVALLGMLTLHNQSTVLHPRITGLKLPPEPTSCIFKLVSPLFQECFLPPGENPCKHLSWNGNLLKADWVEVGHEGRLCQVGQGQGLHSTDGIPENSSSCSWESSLITQLTLSFRERACKVDKAPQRSQQLCPGNRQGVPTQAK